MWTDTYGTIIQKKLSSLEKASIIFKNSLIVFMKVRIKELSYIFNVLFPNFGTSRQVN